MTNAMDISKPNNFQRVLALGESYGVDLEDLLVSDSLTDEQTAAAIAELWSEGYLADPHSALGWRVLQDHLEEGETGVFLCTAHTAKFREDIEEVLGIDIDLPPALAEVADQKILSESIPADFEELRSLLLQC